MPLLSSWLASANAPDCPFPLNNLPCGVFSLGEEEPRYGAAIGDQVLDMAGLEADRLIALPEDAVFDVPFWNEVMDLGPVVWAALRARLQALLAETADPAVVTPYLLPLADVTLHMPFLVAEYTDFYAARRHATNVGTMFRGAENAPPPNWMHIPVGDNGRAASMVVSGTDFRRPWGQMKGPNDAVPRFAPSARLDIEPELGAVVGQANAFGQSVTEADAMIFGYVLLNDWSARDIQAWELVWTSIYTFQCRRMEKPPCRMPL